jgi:dolichol-phosphate mannosyltransferase
VTEQRSPERRPALVVIPTYQEIENIEEVLRRVRAASDADVLVVDDNSPDGTADRVEELGRELGRISVLRRPGKSGLGAAYRAGFAWGPERDYGVLVEMDADLSHQPETVPQLIAPVANGDADLTIGSRYLPGGSIPSWTWLRRAISRWGNRYASMMLNLGITDATSGFRAYGADMLRKVSYDTSSATGYAFQIELAYRVTHAGGRIKEVPILFNDRTLGKSKMSAWIAGEALLMVTRWSLRDRVPLGRRRSAAT